jgi:PilZ domain
MSTEAFKYRLQSIRKRAAAGSQQPIPAAVQSYLAGMPAASAGASALPEASADERRRFARVEAKSEVAMRRIGGFNFQAPLSNLSPGGCNVELVEEAEAGESAIARFPQLEPLGSRICWTKGRTTGLEFLTPIHPAVFDLVVSRLPPRESAA